jgi:nicotinate-nucleotide adenylyltransferase
MAGPIGVLGGTFDPIHVGHLDLGSAARNALGLETLLVVPANIPPHRPQPLASSHHRFAMAALASIEQSGWRLSDVELQDASPSYTSTTLKRLHAAGVSARDLVFVLGADAFAEIESWHAFPSIFDLAHFAVVSRPGHPVADIPHRLPSLRARMVSGSADRLRSATTMIFLIDGKTADVSSTAIRERLAKGQPIAGLVPDRVAQYIEQQQLYVNSPRSAGAWGGSHHAAAGRLHGEE